MVREVKLLRWNKEFWNYYVDEIGMATSPYISVQFWKMTPGLKKGAIRRNA